ncbi:unnamed protein product [Rotaria sordida]|uniref:Copper transport protein n=1 Tax=Rotaria sordida TaxID=392033 RepID=A0A814U7S3_9BILA|nr:unnamed protein product [Rotaria sordida]
MDYQPVMVVTTTTTMMTHVHHMIKEQTNTSSVHSGHGGSQIHNMMMSMTFHGGFKEQILFEQWNTQTMTAFIGSWLLIFFVAILYEGLKTARDQLSKRDGCQCGQEREGQPSLARLLSLRHFIQTILHILQMGISYLLMLIAMTFNIYLFLAIILGAGIPKSYWLSSSQ